MPLRVASPVNRLLEGLREVFNAGRVEPCSGAEDGGCCTGDVGREGGLTDWGWEEAEGCCFLTFLRDDSAPLASERLGEPDRLSALDGAGFLRGPGVLPGR